MKKTELILAAPLLALLATPAIAQASQVNLSDVVLLEPARGVLQIGTAGNGSGTWLAPTAVEVGHARGTLAANGRAKYQLDASLVRYVFVGFGLEFGGLSGVLTPSAGTGGRQLLVEGEWARLDAVTGEFDAVIFEVLGRPIGGVPQLRPVGQMNGRIRYDNFLELQHQNLVAGPSFGQSLEHTGNSTLMSEATLVTELDIPVPGAPASGTGMRLSVTNAATASAMNRSLAHLEQPRTVDGNGTGMGLSIQHIGSAAKDARGRAMQVKGYEGYIRIDDPAGPEASRIAGATVENAPLHVDLGDDASGGLIIDPGETIDPTRTGVFQVTYRMLD